MKSGMSLFIAMLLVLVSTPVAGQIRTWQVSLKDSSLNVAYVGVANYIRADGLPKDGIVMVGNKILSTWDNETFYWSPVTAGFDTLKVFKGRKLLHSNVFEVNQIGPVYAALCGIKREARSVAHILACPGLVAMIDNCHLRQQWHVSSFSAHLFSKQNSIADFRVSGNMLDNDHFPYIRQLKRGDSIVFSDIVMISPDKRSRRSTDFTITIE